MKTTIKSPYAHGSLTQGGLLIKEMRVVARLYIAGLSEHEISERIVKENLFQYPTEKHIQGNIRKSFDRLMLLDNTELIHRIADENTESTRQMCLYSAMKYSRLIWDFMVSVVGVKYRDQNLSFKQEDIIFFY